MGKCEVWEYGSSPGNVNAQAESFANGAVNICYGEGSVDGNNMFIAGIEGGGDNDPSSTGEAVAYTLPGSLNQRCPVSSTRNIFYNMV